MRISDKALKGGIVITGCLTLGAIGGLVAVGGSSAPKAPKVALVQRADSSATTVPASQAPTVNTGATGTVTTTTLSPDQAASSANQSAQSAANSAASAANSATSAANSAQSAATTTTPSTTTTTAPPVVTYCAGSLAADQSAPTWQAGDSSSGNYCNDSVGTFRSGSTASGVPWYRTN